MSGNKLDQTRVAERLYALRQRIGYSRDTISIATQIPAATIKAWESGLRTVKLSSLEKYLKALEKLGCYAEINWVLHGDQAPLPHIVHKSNDNDAISIRQVVELLNTTSNLFYYLDASEHIISIKKDWIHFLGLTNIQTAYTDNNININLQSTLNAENIEFQQLCSKEIYKICHEHYLKCMKGKTISFSYFLNNEFSKNHTKVTMLYSPIFRHSDFKIVGIFAFLSSKAGI